MLDFLKIKRKDDLKKHRITVYPEFSVIPSKDLMIRGGKYYAIYDEEDGLWKQDPFAAIRIIDGYIDEFAAKVDTSGYPEPKPDVVPLYLRSTDNGQIDKWKKFVEKQMSDWYKDLDGKIIFANTKTRKNDYASKKLEYSLEEGSIENYDKMMSVLYSPAERHKIEWTVGSIAAGASKNIQKFVVLYGAAGTGKSTVINIITMLFDGYCKSFSAKALTNGSAFGLSPFKDNPLVAYEHDGDLSHISDNTVLNSVVSHEVMPINEKHKAIYEMKVNAMLFVGSNNPVKITDANSGLLRRLIDVTPTGKKLGVREYDRVMDQIPFELGAIANHCKEVYLADPKYYKNYIPNRMLSSTNEFYNFVLDRYDWFTNNDPAQLKHAYVEYKNYCVEADVRYPLNRMAFKEELTRYYENFFERTKGDGNTTLRNIYSGFKKELLDYSEDSVIESYSGLDFKEQESLFDKECCDFAAQYANEKETPAKKWEKVTTKLVDLDTSKLHYVMVPLNHIVIDFDLKDGKGNKSFKKNLEAANKWPKTYAELSKGGQGIHLHYIYDGDPEKLARIYEEDIEIKVFTGNSSLRRRLSKCVNNKIAHINSGLPLKREEKKKVVNFDGVKSEKKLRSMIIKALKKEYENIPPYTRPNIDFINKILSDAYDSGMKYDVTDLRPAVLDFASKSTNQANECIKIVNKMKFASEEISDIENKSDEPIIFYDCEVFSNLFVICWKFDGAGNVVRMINPSSSEVEELVKHKLVGFNCRRYDNHILYARMMGYSNEQLYSLSQKIISGSKNAMFGEAYNLSYTDIWDFSSKKQSLKKFEIELGIHHQECPLKWDEPAPEDKWEMVADYCCNDVIATEATFHARYGDFVAREILADIADMTVNDTTNSLTTRIIFGKNRKPQSEFYYRDLSKPIKSIDPEAEDFIRNKTSVDIDAWNEGGTMLPYFKGYKFDNGVSIYMGEEVGEGGYVFAKPGMYYNAKVFDVASMHPHSITSEYLFGPYTSNFNDLMEARVAIKHKDFDKAKKKFDGALEKYLTDESSSKALANALKTAINSVYGLTAAKFDNPFRDPRNKDNFVAKRGALFMATLRHEVEARGFTVIHCKTDSIKIEKPTKEIEDFIISFGNMYGYQFEVENVFERVCLVNDAVFIAKCAKDDPESPGEWTATGAQFAHPYVFKKLFTHEDVTFEDLCETKTVSSALYLDMNESLPEGEHCYQFVGKAGSFCPMLPYTGGGILYREKDGQYNAATGTKGYRWLESETVKQNNKEGDIDMSYFEKLAEDAKASINEFGSFDRFVCDKSFEDFMDVPDGYEDTGVPWDETK